MGIVNDVLDISKIENGSLVCENIEFNPFKEFNAICDLFSAKAKEKNITIVTVIDPKISQQLIGDPLRIKQVLSNLVSNAIKFSKENSKIELTIRLVSQNFNSCKVRFSVRDYGIGINKEKQKTIFEDFTQADESTSRKYGGTGLGLSISNKIINILGSQIEIKSKENEGSEFCFTLEYKINKENSKNLEELKDLKVGIILSDKINEYDYDELKIYLDSIVSVTIYQDIDTIENIEDEDIILLDESQPFDKIVKIDNFSTSKVILLSKRETKYQELKNSIILNPPFNRSVIFDILVGFIDKSYSNHSAKEISYKQFKGKVLIAEDHQVNQQLISMLLELRGIEFEFANNGQEAVDLFHSSKYDMILMDINMPIKNGKDATKEIIELENKNNLKHTPIVALTANAIETDREETMQIGFDAYLLKPLDEIKLDEIFTKYLTVENGKTTDTNSVESTDEPFSIEKVSALSGLPVVVLKKIVANFIENIDDDMEQLHAAITQNNFEQIQNYSHKIKGASLNLRMEKISQITQNIETQSSNKEDTSLKKDFDALVKEIEIIKKLDL